MDLTRYLQDLRARQTRARPVGTPHEVVHPLGEITIPEHVEHWAAHRPEHPAIVFRQRTITYRELDDLIKRVGGWLSSASVRAGDRVAVLLPNCPQFVVAMMAALRIGAVHVPVNPMFRGPELAHELRDSGAEVVITADSLLPVLAQVRDETPVREVLVTADPLRGDDLAAPGIPPEVGAASPWADAVAHPPTAVLERDLDALAALNYTGGTTGLPKGCEHTQRHMLYTAASTAGATQQSSDGGFVALCYIPIFWIAGENLGALGPLVLGGTSVLLPRWDATEALEAIHRHRATTTVGTVENYLELLDHPRFAEHDLSSLTDPMAVSFVRKLDTEVRRRWSAAVGPGSLLREGAYGMTETHTFDATPYALAEGDMDLRAEPVFCGLPVPGTDIAVVSFETGEPLPLGEEGEIVVRSPSVMTGYWKQPEATARQLRDGWLRTGDLGRIDEHGYVHYLGRNKDLIKVKGMSVFPAEVEILLSRHPAVHSVAVVAASHPEKGQQPVAFVRATDDALDVAALRTWAAEQMATYKVPLVEIVEEFPMTTTGKVRKVELADRAQHLSDER